MVLSPSSPQATAIIPFFSTKVSSLSAAPLGRLTYGRLRPLSAFPLADEPLPTYAAILNLSVLLPFVSSCLRARLFASQTRRAPSPCPLPQGERGF